MLNLALVEGGGRGGMPCRRWSISRKKPRKIGCVALMVPAPPLGQSLPIPWPIPPPPTSWQIPLPPHLPSIAALTKLINQRDAVPKVEQIKEKAKRRAKFVFVALVAPSPPLVQFPPPYNLANPSPPPLLKVEQVKEKAAKIWMCGIGGSTPTPWPIHPLHLS
ncbi:hypothetical protein niasHT_004399 [Heterodera trifolii]|uniref:Uncharacterized protein n=1 Tax=Heterodera trifolii TaxID=157864 RepID=A0ABD2LLX4_9BILA